MAEFRMPSLGADMEAGTLVEWLKHPGDRVQHGDIVAVVETQKGAIEVEIFEDGVIDRLLVEPGATVPVGTPLALIDGGGEAAAAPPQEEPAAAPPQKEPPAPPPPRPQPAREVPLTPAPVPPAYPEPTPPRPAPTPPRPAPTPPRPAPSPPAAAEGRRRASPAARRLAAARGIDLAGLAGSGPDGAIVYADVEQAKAEARRPGGRGLDLAEMRKAIAAAMARSKREIPHYYLATTIDLTCALAWLEAANAGRPPAERILLAALLLKAVAGALGKAPEFNGFYTADGFRAGPGIHLGTAVAIRGGGLIAPAIRDADKVSLDALMARLKDLVARTRSGALRSSELSDPTITVTSLGERGVESVFGVIYPPQVALVGFGMPVERPWVVDGQVAARRVLTASLAADHRVSDGHRGALFLADIDRRLQTPETL